MSGLERLNYRQVSLGLELDDPLDTDPAKDVNDFNLKQYRKDFFWRLRQIAAAAIQQSHLDNK